MLRKLGSTIAIASAFIINNVNALGLGDITVKSALNEPLYAEIDLFQVNNLSPLQVKSRMADLNDFALSGLATQRALSNVRFQTRIRANGTGRIILTSKLPVTEPFMNFLVEVNWPSGRLIREYTLLLDPPSYESQQNGDFTVNNTAKPARTQPVRTVQKPAATSTTPNNVTVKAGQYYINSKDTLWDIAISNRPSSRVTPQQMMVLMQRKNPQAFPNGNINVMKANVVIDIPTQTEIDALSVKEAQDEVDNQTRLWRTGQLPAIVSEPSTGDNQSIAQELKELTKPVSSEGDSSAVEEVKTAETMSPDDKKMSPADSDVKTPDQKDLMVSEKGAEEKGMLDVVSPEEAMKQKELQAKADAMAIAASKDSKQIEQLLKDKAELDVKLALSQESIDKLERDNSELDKKLSNITKQLEDINRLIMLKDEQLAVMQDEFENIEKNQQEQEQERIRKEQEKSWLDKFLDNPMAMVTAGIGWLLAIAAGTLLLLRRKKKDDDLVEDAAKSEPTVSLPDAIEEEIESLEEIDKSSESDAPVEDDLDLDLDLDMGMDLDESLNNESLEISEEEGDLAAELDAQLDEPDDLDLLDGMDSLEFDLGEDDADDSLEIEETLDVAEESDEDAEQKALDEFAAAMEAPDEESEEDAEQKALDEFAAAMEAPDEESEEDAEQKALDEFAAAMEAPDEESEEDAEQKALDEFAAAMEAPDEESEEDAEQKALDEFAAAMEAPDEEVDVNSETEVLEDDVNVSVVDDELDISELEEDLLDPEDLEIELEESDLEIESAEDDLVAENDLDDAIQNDDELKSEDEKTESLEEVEEDELEIVLDEDVDDDIENSVEDEPVPMDDALSDLLNDTEDGDFEVSENEEIKDPQVELEDQVAELLSSTDDEIALEEVSPEFDADNEENIDLLSGEDGLRMKLDLARAYIEMGDGEGAKDIIKEVFDAGDKEYLEEAEELLNSIDS